ncbi:MAG: hypothetical protein JSW03_02980 [Candidatus Eiseniibacteriota bacterium]|nr:MAG: hypothetical protein JSW03_02980 [Candidatus Eisenbacteria bacterium]
MTWYNGGVYAQRIEPSGNVSWKADGVPISTAPGSVFPRIATDGAGGAIVTWSDLRGTMDYDIYAQRVDSEGKVLWAADGVPICTTSCNERCRRIAEDGAGGAIITWSDDRNGVDCDIYAQRVDSSGKTLWKVNGVPVCTADQDQGFPTIAPDGSGGAIIAWADFRNGTDYCIFAQRVDGSGRALWTTDGVAVCTTPGSQLPRMTSDGNGGAILAWRDPRNTSNYDIYAQRVDGSGEVSWAENGIPICTISGAKWWPLIASDEAGGAIVAWRDYRSGTNYDIYAQRVDPSGKPLWNKNGVPVCVGARNERYHDMAPDGASGATIVWFDERRAGGDDIYAQRLNAKGEASWKLNGVTVCTAPEDQLYPNVTPDSDGGVIISWLDFRTSTDYDVYAQKVNADGSVGPIARGPHEPDPELCK